MTRLLYFAWVREMVGTGEELVDLPPDAATVNAVLDWLASTDERRAAAFADRARLRAAVDGQFVGADASVEEAREIAIFPPVTGG